MTVLCGGSSPPTGTKIAFQLSYVLCLFRSEITPRFFFKIVPFVRFLAPGMISGCKSNTVYTCAKCGAKVAQKRALSLSMFANVPGYSRHGGNGNIHTIQCGTCAVVTGVY